DGIYRTTGGAPVKISTAIDPLFGVGGAVPPYYQGSTPLWPTSAASLFIHRNRLYVSFLPTSGGRNKTLVYDIPTGTGMFWAITSTAVGGAGGGPPIFAFAGVPSPAGTNDLGILDSSLTTDNGTAITSRYRSGFLDLDSPRFYGVEKTVRSST